MRTFLKLSTVCVTFFGLCACSQNTIDQPTVCATSEPFWKTYTYSVLEDCAPKDPPRYAPKTPLQQ